MEIKFWKMHGLGNDYIIIDNRIGLLKEGQINSLAKNICQRNFSVGADGLLLLMESKKADVRMLIINADGSEAEMCGNGIRCFAKYCYENRIVRKKYFTIETLAGLRSLQVFLKGGSVQNVYVDMGKPSFERNEIPMKGNGKCIDEPLKVNGRQFKMTCLSIGNPHCVIFINDIKDFPVKDIGPKIERNGIFPNRVNVDFAQIVNRKKMRLRVWERGVGETFACGTGACAAVVAGNILGKNNREVIVNLHYGDLRIEYNDEISLFGPAEKVFEGKILVNMN